MTFNDLMIKCAVAGAVTTTVLFRTKVLKSESDPVLRTVISTAGTYVGGCLGLLAALSYRDPAVGVAIFGPWAVNIAAEAVGL